MASYGVDIALTQEVDELSRLRMTNDQLRAEHRDLMRQACELTAGQNKRLQRDVEALRNTITEANRFEQQLPPVSDPAATPPPPYAGGSAAAYNTLSDVPAYAR